MSLWADYRDDYESFEASNPDSFLPGSGRNSLWPAKSGDVRVCDMSDSHIINCMKIVGLAVEWYRLFEEELEIRSRCERVSNGG